MKRALLLTLLPFAAGITATRMTLPETLEAGAFAIVQEVVVPVEPERAFALFTEDVGQWWDHCFSGDSSNLSMDARPGGYFLETFGEGQGCIHAQFTFVKVPERLVMRGPLGFQGKAFDLVCSLDFEAVEGGSTRVRATARAIGEMEEGWDAAVDGVWKHFLTERFLPYVREQG